MTYIRPDDPQQNQRGANTLNNGCYPFYDPTMGFPGDTVAIFSRVSTGDQTTENQSKQLIEWAERRGWSVVLNYQVEGTAWKTHSDQMLNQALVDARAGKYRYLLVWSLDRLSRQGSLETLQILDRFRQLGVDVISLQESWTEMGGSVRDLLAGIMGWIAKQESDRKSERVKAGLERTRAKGTVLGRRPNVPYVDLNLVAELKAKGIGWGKIQKAHPRTVPGATGRKCRPSTTTIRRAWKSRA